MCNTPNTLFLCQIYVYFRQTCNTGVTPRQQPRYQQVHYCTYCTILGSFTNCNIIKFSHKSTTRESFDDINQVIFDDTSDDMASLVLVIMMT